MSASTHRESVVANAIGFEMLRHDGRPTYLKAGIETIDVTAKEERRCMVAARRVLTHLAAFDAVEAKS